VQGPGDQLAEDSRGDGFAVGRDFDQDRAGPQRPGDEAPGSCQVGPPVDRDLIDGDAALSQQFPGIPVRQSIPQVPADRDRDRLGWNRKPANTEDEHDYEGCQPVTSAGSERADGKEERYAIYVWRAQRHGGDTKTGKSRRALALPRRCVDALQAHHRLQAEDRLRARRLWQDHGLVFASAVGTPLSASNVIRAFQGMTEKAELGTAWAPREMRLTFASVLSANEVPLESIALLASTTGQARPSWSTGTNSGQR
jgi:hypothetical protein